MKEPTQEEFCYLASALLNFSSTSEHKQEISVTFEDNDLDPYKLPISPEMPASDGGSLKTTTRAQPILRPLKTVSKKKAAAMSSRPAQKRVPKKSILDIEEEKENDIPEFAAKSDRMFTVSREINETASDQNTLIPSTPMPVSKKKEHPVATKRKEVVKNQELIRGNNDRSHPRVQKPLVLISSDPILEDDASDYGDAVYYSAEAVAKLEPKKSGPEVKKRRKPSTLNTNKRMRDELDDTPYLNQDQSRTKEDKIGENCDNCTTSLTERGHQAKATKKRRVSHNLHCNLGPIGLKDALMGSLTTDDPFVAAPENSSTEKTTFTIKLLHDSTMASSLWKPLHKMPSPHRNLSTPDMVSTRGNGPEPGRVGIEMMQALAPRQAKCEKSSKTAKNSRQIQYVEDDWLNETGSYKETSHIMNYVCRTILRFLKSKEDAIVDISQEYLQRGMAVVNNVRTLHEIERLVVAHRFSERRTACIETCEAARHTIGAIAAKLMHVPVASAVSELMEESLTSRLVNLQAEAA